MSATRANSFKRTVEGLEERALLSAAPASPLTGAALGVLQQSYANLQVLGALPLIDTHGGGSVCAMPGQVGNILVAEKDLQNAMNLCEQYENFFEAVGYDGSGFRALDFYFRVIDQAVMNEAVAVMQFYYNYDGSHP
jgi:hypothetical protein